MAEDKQSCYTTVHTTVGHYRGVFCEICGKSLQEGEAWSERFYAHVDCLYRLTRLMMLHKNENLKIKGLKIIEGIK